MISLEGHEFWSDSFSLTEPGRVERSRLRGHDRVTDAYLLALAVDRGGRLATYDKKIRTLFPETHEREILIQMGV